MLEDILEYKTEEFFGYKREKRKIFSKGNREDLCQQIPQGNITTGSLKNFIIKHILKNLTGNW